MKQKTKTHKNHFWDIVVNPKRYFTKIVADGSLDESMFKAFIYGLIGGCLVLAIKLIGGATMTIDAVFSAAIIFPVLAVVLLFVGGGLLMLVSEITGGERDWEIAIKGLASVMFVYPVILVLNALAFNCTTLWIVSLLCDVYLLFLFYNLGVYCLHGKKSNVIMVVAMLALFLATVYITDYRIGWFMIKNAPAAQLCWFV